MDKNKYIFSLEIKVRDYELDSEGIVNNANYQHYLEHTRHEFCIWAGLSFDEMQKRGIIPVINRVEIDYKLPLRSGDVVESKLWVERKGVRFIFHQDIFRLPDNAKVLEAVVSSVYLQNGRLSKGDALFEVFKDFLK